jgi:hypothetical protein
MATAVVGENRSLESLEEEESAEAEAAETARGRDEHATAEKHDERADALRKRIDRLKAEAGPATDSSDPAAEAAEAERRDSEADALTPEEIIVSGIEMDLPQLGGKPPEGGTLTLTGASALLAEGTSLPKGTTISGRFVAVVDDVGSKDKRDKETNQVSDCVAYFKAAVTDLVLDPIEE